VDGQESPVDWMRVRRQASSQGKDRTEQNVIKLWIRMGVSRKQENSSQVFLLITATGKSYIVVYSFPR
jgi:hypothetical protein